MNLLEVDDVYIITNKKNFPLIKGKVALYNNVFLIDEDNLIEGLSFSAVKKELEKIEGGKFIIGWFFQQFLKLGFGVSRYAKQYYLCWDADTIPLTNLVFEEKGKLFFDVKKEFHEPYFKTIENLFGINKQISQSFISEHMVFDVSIVKEMISLIIRNRKKNNTNWWNEIIKSCDFEQSLNCFSEFETYGTYCMFYHPERYQIRQLSSFRKGSLISGRFLNKRILSSLSFDNDIVTFEARDIPPFPWSILQRLNNYIVSIISYIIKCLSF